MDDQIKVQLPYEQSGERNDLVCRLWCGCKHFHNLMGYNDANFFYNVNAQPRETHFPCGRVITQQWLMNGTVEITEVSKTE